MRKLVDAGRGAALVPETAARLHVPDAAFRSRACGASPVVRLNAAWHPGNDNRALARLLAEASGPRCKPERSIQRSHRSRPRTVVTWIGIPAIPGRSQIG